MKFEWNQNKRISNFKKHQLDFIGSENIFDGYTVTIEDDRQNYSEQRLITFGTFHNRLVAVVHTETKDVIRIISIHKATKNEIRGYYATITI